MRSHRRTSLARWLLLLIACELPVSVEPNCDTRQAFYPDVNADGIGDTGRVYIGCDAPEGWVAVPPTRRRTDDTGATGRLVDTGATGDTGSTAPTETAGDTGATAHTGTTDTGATTHTGATTDTGTSGPTGASADTSTGPAGTPATGTTGDTGL